MVDHLLRVAKPTAKATAKPTAKATAKPQQMPQPMPTAKPQPMPRHGTRRFDRAFIPYCARKSLFTYKKKRGIPQLYCQMRVTAEGLLWGVMSIARLRYNTITMWGNNGHSLRLINYQGVGFSIA